MASSSDSGELRLKLLIDSKSQKVLFAEAGKEFIDFLFSFMALPLGTVTALLTKTSMVGSLGNLYHSIETLNQSYFLQPTQNKESILNPKICAADNYQTPLLFISHKNEPFTNLKAYVCKNLNTRSDTYFVGGPAYYHGYVANDLNSVCPDCKNKMETEVTYVSSPEKVAIIMAIIMLIKSLFAIYVNSFNSNLTAQYRYRDAKHGYVANDLNSVCPDCNNKMDTEVTYVSSPEKVGSINGDGGFVKGVVTYMVMDNLEVKPMSSISSITLINTFCISDIGSLEEKEVAVGVNEVFYIFSQFKFKLW